MTNRVAVVPEDAAHCSTCEKGVRNETIRYTHRVVGHLHVDDYEGWKAVLAGEVRLAGQCRRRGQLHVLRNVHELEVEAVCVHIQQAAWEWQPSALSSTFDSVRSRLGSASCRMLYNKVGALSLPLRSAQQTICLPRAAHHPHSMKFLPAAVGHALI